MAHFEEYVDIPMIAEIKGRVDAVAAELTDQLMESVADVSMILQSLPGHLRSLPDACLVVDSLGNQVRHTLLEEFVQQQLAPYDQLFGYGKQHCTLEEVDRRWAWFKRLLKTVDTKFSSLCPQHWRLPLRLCVEFMRKTKRHVSELLAQLESKDAVDVSSLLKALQTSLRFEQEMCLQFETLFKPFGFERGMRANTSMVDFEDESMVQRSAVHQEIMDQCMDSFEKNAPADPTLDNIERLFLIKSFFILKGGISNGFDRYMGSYVVLERHNLEDLLRRLSTEDDTAQSNNESGPASGNVYGSSISMFVYIKNSIKRCTALTTGQTFYSLTKEFKACLQQYADMLKTRCPPLSGPTTIASTGQNYVPQPLCKITVGQESVICYVINTGEYCSEV
ncbi:unnamed protein product [Sphagnum jensenii]|uniref:Vps53 N-terminal domain-containing protein n=1 Tax=Sphagnum jensenii TaxID=128206 RepID=A0ABP0VF55_9BRYO